MSAFLVSFMANTSEMLRTDGKHNPDVFWLKFIKMKMDEHVRDGGKLNVVSAVI